MCVCGAGVGGCGGGGEGRATTVEVVVAVLVVATVVVVAMMVTVVEAVVVVVAMVVVAEGFIYLLVFNAQPTGTVTSRRYTLQNLLIIKNKTWLIKRTWFLIEIKWQNIFKSLYRYHIE